MLQWFPQSTPISFTNKKAAEVKSEIGSIADGRSALISRKLKYKRASKSLAFIYFIYLLIL